MFSSKRYKKIFIENHLSDFNALWANKVKWFEEPNQRRGGWSGVGRMQLPLQQQGKALDIFIKKQKNHGRRSLLHPIAGEPTFRREYRNLLYLEKHHFNAPHVVYYDEQHDQHDRAILIVETLKGYVPLDEFIASAKERGVTRQQKKAVIYVVANALRNFHQLRLQHRALYPKHIFVNILESQPQAALIDLEKARFNLVALRRAYYDLSTLHKHAEGWTRSERLYFLLCYFKRQKVGWFIKKFAHQLNKRSGLA